MPDKVRWGIVSTANIGVAKVIPGIQKSPHSEVVAIASRELSKAKAVADRLGIRKAYGSYEDLLADPGIDAIYNPLPNHLHVPVTIAATKAGKHVLCEKPIAMNAAEAERLRECPRDKLVLEAFMVRFHPQWHRVREIVRSGELGEVRAIRAVFSYYLTDPANVRNIAEIGGGGLMDIGCYPITGSRFVFESEPRRVVSLVERDPDFGTDRLSTGILDFGSARATFTVGTRVHPHQRVEVLGEKGSLSLGLPFNAYPDVPMKLEIRTGLGTREVAAGPLDQYAELFAAFSRALRSGAPAPTPVADGIANMAVLDSLFRSAERGGWVEVEG